MKTAVEKIFVEKGSLYDRASCRCEAITLSMRLLHAVSGWEKGQVENQVGLVRERFFSRVCDSRILRN